MYYSKNGRQRTREGMRNHRMRKQAEELARFTQDEQDEDSPTDTSHVIDQNTNGSTDDPKTTSIDLSILLSLPDPPDRSLLDVSVNINQDSECYTDCDDVDDLIPFYDLNNQKKPFSACPLSIYDASLVIIKLARRLNLDKSGTKRLLDGIRHICPNDVEIPCTVKGLMKIIGEHEI